jgi:aminomethyltransferase
MEPLKRTSLYDTHRRLGARFTAFAGFEMPVSYGGIVEEHLAVRRAAGLFDLSHMGEFELSGPPGLALLERALSNSAAHLAPGRAQYTLMCAEDGGTIDDLIVYRLDLERYLVCVNAANIKADREEFLSLGGDRVGLSDRSAETGLLALQGPAAERILAELAPPEVCRLARFAVAEAELAGLSCVIARTGYTGEDGFEIFVPAEQAASLFEALLERGARFGLKPCGLGARDTLRLEAGLPLYGHELDRAISPLEAGLGAFVKLERDFVGASALRRQAQQGTARRLVGLLTDDARTPARQGYPVMSDGRRVGAVTSGSYAPALRRPVAMAYVETAFLAGNDIAASAPVTVEVRGRLVASRLACLPFYRRPAKKQAEAADA